MNIFNAPWLPIIVVGALLGSGLTIYAFVSHDWKMWCLYGLSLVSAVAWLFNADKQLFSWIIAYLRRDRRIKSWGIYSSDYVPKMRFVLNFGLWYLLLTVTFW